MAWYDDRKGSIREVKRTSRHNPGMRLALATAKSSTHSIFKHGAVITTGKRPLASGTNTPSSDHAEEHAIKQLPRNRHNLTIYIARIDKSGGLKLSRPCRKCMNLIKKLNISSLIYTTEKGWVKEQIL